MYIHVNIRYINIILLNIIEYYIIYIMIFVILLNINTKIIKVISKLQYLHINKNLFYRAI